MGGVLYCLWIFLGGGGVVFGLGTKPLPDMPGMSILVNNKSYRK